VTVTTDFVKYHHEPQNKWEPLYLATDDFSRQRQGREAVNCLMADGSDLPVLRAVLIGGASAKEESLKHY